MISANRPASPALPLALGLLFVSTYLMAPASGVVRALLHSLVGVAATAVIWRRVAPLPADRRHSWAVLAAGVTCVVVADTTTAAVRLWARSSALTITGWHLLYGMGTLLIAAGLLRLVRDPRHDRTITLDAVTVTTGTCVVIWVAVVDPVWASLGGTGVGRVHVVLYPASHLVLFAVSVRVAMLRSQRSRPTMLLLAGAALQLLAATAIGVAIALGAYHTGSSLDLAWMGASALYAAATLEGVRRDRLETAPRSSTPERVTHLRVTALGASLLLLPVVMLVMATDWTQILVAGATAVLLVLVVVRISSLIEALERAREQAVADQERRDQRRLEAIVRHTEDALLVIGQTGVVTYASPAAASACGSDPLGWSRGELAARLHPDERQATVEALVERLAERTGKPIRLRARLTDRADREHHVDLVAVDLSDDPDVNGIVVTLHETTERTELEAELRRLAFHDPLTGLSNREVFQDRLAQALERAARSGRRIAVLLCDLDDFKDVNDTLGHPAGDRLLQQVAARLRGLMRAADTVARLGGDEFAMLCEDLPSARDAVLTAQRLLETVRQPITICGSELTVSMSVGIAVDTGERNGEELLRDADIALYEAKADGKQGWSLHRTTMTLQAQARLELGAELARDVASGEIEVLHQPIVTLTDGRMIGAESLMRWECRGRGPVEPDEFIPVAEQSALIVALGDVVLERSLATLRQWLDARPDLLMRTAVNCSARQLRDLELADRVLGMLERHRIDPSLLMLELTESVIMGDLEVALEVMHRLRDAGVRFAIDDFGTGYSSLSYIRRLPVDVVKIDRSFVHELATDPAARGLVQTIVDLGANLHLDVVAEGVETEEQRDLLTAMGCGFAQGYLFSPPVSAESLTATLAADGTITAPPVASSLRLALR